MFSGGPGTVYNDSQYTIIQGMYEILLPFFPGETLPSPRRPSLGLFCNPIRASWGLSESTKGSPRVLRGPSEGLLRDPWGIWGFSKVIWGLSEGSSKYNSNFKFQMTLLKIRLLPPLRLKTHSTNAPIVMIISIVLMMSPTILKMNMKTTRQKMWLNVRNVENNYPEITMPSNSIWELNICRMQVTTKSY